MHSSLLEVYVRDDDDICAHWPDGQSLHTTLAFIHLRPWLRGDCSVGCKWALAHTHTHTHTLDIQVCCVHFFAPECHLCADVKHGGREIGRSSLVAGKWGDLFFGSFPVKVPGDQDTENIYLYTSYVLHKRDGEPERERGRVSKHMKMHVCLIKEGGGEVKCRCAGGILVFWWHHTDLWQIEA